MKKQEITEQKRKEFLNYLSSINGFNGLSLRIQNGKEYFLVYTKKNIHEESKRAIPKKFKGFTVKQKFGEFHFQ